MDFYEKKRQEIIEHKASIIDELYGIENGRTLELISNIKDNGFITWNNINEIYYIGLPIVNIIRYKLSKLKKKEEVSYEEVFKNIDLKLISYDIFMDCFDIFFEYIWGINREFIEDYDKFILFESIKNGSWSKELNDANYSNIIYNHI